MYISTKLLGGENFDPIKFTAARFCERFFCVIGSGMKMNLDIFFLWGVPCWENYFHDQVIYGGHFAKNNAQHAERRGNPTQTKCQIRGEATTQM